MVSDAPPSLSSSDLAWLLGAYAAALLGALLVVALLPGGPLLVAAVADLVATLVVFGFSIGLRNSSLYDPYWSVAPPLLALYWWLELGARADTLTLLVLGLVLVWAIRLTWNWARGWAGLNHEDWRYRRLQDQLGRWYWPVSLLGIHLLPTVLVFIGCVPLYLFLAADPAALDWLLGSVACLVGALAIWLEGRADNQLRRFRLSRETAAEVLNRGVWRLCRHPNYLGELGFWLFLGLAAGSAGVVWHYGLIGVFVMAGLFGIVSIPMIERKLLAAKPDYAAYCAATYALLPIGAVRRGTVVWELPLRLWHWCFAVAIAAALYTGLSGDIGLLERHQQIGYFLLGLVLFRMAWWLWGGRYTRAGSYRTSWRALRAHFQGVGQARPQTAPGALIALVFVVLVAIQVTTGLFATDDIFTEGPLTRHVSGDTASAMTWIHHRVFWLIIAAIAVHLLAHVVYGLRGDATPAAMITGRKPLPLEPAQPALARAAGTAVVCALAVWAFLEFV